MALLGYASWPPPPGALGTLWPASVPLGTGFTLVDPGAGLTATISADVTGVLSIVDEAGIILATGTSSSVSIAALEGNAVRVAARFTPGTGSRRMQLSLTGTEPLDEQLLTVAQANATFLTQAAASATYPARFGGTSTVAAAIPFLNVKDYGAKGDGATDDTAAIGLAFAAGKNIFFPPGTYRVSSYLNIDSTVAARVITGVPGASIIKFADTAPAGGANTLVLSVNNGANDVSIDGIVFDGNSSVLTAFVSAVVVYNCQRVQFTRCTWQNSRAVGLLFSTSIVECAVQSSKFINVGFTGGVTGANRYQAIAFSEGTPGNSYRNLVANNSFNNIGLDCISLQGQYDTVASGNRCNVIGAAGVYGGGAIRCTISGNVIRSGPGVGAPGASGIDLANAESCTVTGNVCYEMSSSGIALTGKNVTITGNSCINNNQDGGAAKQAGIYIRGGSGHTIAGNTCTDTQGIKTQQYGVILDTAATGIKVGVNALAGNGTADYAAVNFAVDQSSTVYAGNSLTAAATLTVSPWHDVVFVSGNTGITSITAAESGRRVTLVFSGTPTVTDGGNLKLAGNFVATADDSLTLVCDGTSWFEESRSAN